MPFCWRKRLFDQSIVGVFPKDETHLCYILAFLNSDVCNRILKVINHTTNNSANYLKKLPIIFDEQYFDVITRVVENILAGKDIASGLKQIDNFFENIYQVPE